MLSSAIAAVPLLQRASGFVPLDPSCWARKPPSSRSSLDSFVDAYLCCTGQQNCWNEFFTPERCCKGVFGHISACWQHGLSWVDCCVGSEEERQSCSSQDANATLSRCCGSFATGYDACWVGGLTWYDCCANPDVHCWQEENSDIMFSRCCGQDLVGATDCWMKGYTWQHCCTGYRTGCFETTGTFTFQQCCTSPGMSSPASLLLTGAPSETLLRGPPLALGQEAALKQELLKSCWPTRDAATSFQECCALRHGVYGSRLCFESSGLTFSRCCNEAVVAGLDRCTRDAGSWCSDERIGWNEEYFVDHRAYVGRGVGHATWEGEAHLIVDFLKEYAGVRPSTRVLELACGSLRIGRLLIPYLDRGNYLCIEKSRRLIEAGWFSELDEASREQSPAFVASGLFEMELFKELSAPVPDMSFAISLLTHLSSSDIGLLLQRLGAATAGTQRQHRFYATVRLRDSVGIQAPVPAEESSAVARFFYSFQELAALAAPLGWKVEVPSFHGIHSRFKESPYTELFHQDQRLVVFSIEHRN